VFSDRPSGEPPTAKSSAPRRGWLIVDRSYQDIALFALFRCPQGCKAGVLLRAEKTAGGRTTGIFVSLTEGDLASYRVTLDAQGTETSREGSAPMRSSWT
jgi:hypothetical protein